MDLLQPHWGIWNDTALAIEYDDMVAEKRKNESVTHLRRGRWRLWEEKEFGILGIVNLCKCVFYFYFGPQLMTGS
jgi:hypothetical protein